MNKKILIVSGGTGGHIVPARVLAQALARSHQVTFLGDVKIRSYIDEKDAFKSIIICSSQIKKSLPALALGAIKITIGFLHSLIILLIIRPKFIFAFGGYATFPTLLAAVVTRRKIILHEQNSHLGKVNRIFAKYAHKIATSFPKTSGITDENLTKIVFTGNPVRDEILELNNLTYEFPEEPEEEDLMQNRMGYNVLLASDFRETAMPKSFKILIIGGSGGAKIFSEILPKAFFNLKHEIKDKIEINQQCREGSVQSTFDQYCSYNISVATASFFNNMPELIKESHLIIARAGSSSIFEFCAAKKPMILVPFANSADNHQVKNAAYLIENKAAIVIHENDFTIAKVSEVLRDLIDNKTKLEKLSENAGKLTTKDSTQKLINLSK